jgi:hypothetical protein
VGARACGPSPLCVMSRIQEGNRVVIQLIVASATHGETPVANLLYIWPVGNPGSPIVKFLLLAGANMAHLPS